jgi:hypothetical protein
MLQIEFKWKTDNKILGLLFQQDNDKASDLHSGRFQVTIHNYSLISLQRKLHLLLTHFC